MPGGVGRGNGVGRDPGDTPFSPGESPGGVGRGNGIGRDPGDTPFSPFCPGESPGGVGRGNGDPFGPGGRGGLGGGDPDADPSVPTRVVGLIRRS